MIALDAAISPVRLVADDKDGLHPSGETGKERGISDGETAKRLHPVTHIDTGGGSKGPNPVGRTRIESQPQNPIATKSSTDIRTPASVRKYVMAGVAAAVLISGLAYFFTRPNSSPAAQPQVPDYSHARYNDPALSNCKGNSDCQERKAQADKLAGVQDWNKLPYNSLLLRDCMAYEPCLARKAHAEQLLAVTDWRRADKQLLSDCMSYQPCVKENRPPVVSSGDEGDLPGCCKNAANPAACRATKKKEQLPDCASPLDSN